MTNPFDATCNHHIKYHGAITQRVVDGAIVTEAEPCVMCENEKLRAQLAAAREDADRLDNALHLAIDELCGQLHGPRSAVFETAYDARSHHEQLRKQ